MAEQVIGFVTFNPGSGDGNQAVQVTATAHTGRNQRTATAKVASSDGSLEKTVTVNQKAKAEFVEIQETFSLAKEGGAITITGKSNSTKLTFSLAPGEGEAALELTFPETYLAASKPTANDAEIEGDPGATAEYDFSVTISDVPANLKDNDVTNTLSVQAAGGQQDSCLITQAAGDKTLSIDPETITLEADGSAQTLNVTSNTQWTIKQA